MTTPTLVVPSAADLGALASEVAATLKTRGDPDASIALALRTALLQIEADLATLALLADAGVGVVHLSQVIAFGDFAALGAGVKTLDYTLGPLTTNATLFAVVKATDFTGFDNGGGGGTATLVVGTSAGGNQVGTSLNVATGQTGFPKQFTAGAAGFPTSSLSGSTITIRFTSGADLNTFTAGSVKAHLYYFVLP